MTLVSPGREYSVSHWHQADEPIWNRLARDAWRVFSTSNPAIATSDYRAEYIFILLPYHYINLPQAQQADAANNVLGAPPPPLPPIPPAQQTQQMVQALIRLGLTEVAAREFTDNGITTLHRLRTLSEDDLKALIKQIHRDNAGGGAGLLIPFGSQQYIQAIRFWAGRMHITGRPYNVQDVDEQLAAGWAETMKIEKEASVTPTDIIKAPEPFKKETKWKMWRESLATYLHSKSGQASIPLAYIIRDNDIAPPDAVYTTSHDLLVNRAIHYGMEYNTNNGIVFDLLQSLTLNGPAWSWISGFQATRDGRGAWKALTRYYEGDAMQTRSKQECYDSIAKATYQGPKRTFDFSSYVAIHQQAHQDLTRLGEPIPENKKVRDFLQGITDPQCQNIKLNVLSNPFFMNDFAQTINYMASAIDMITKNTSTSSRQISETKSSVTNSGRGSQGRGGRGHGRGRGRGRGRGGRGRGNSNNQSSNNSTSTNDSRSITRGYSREEWQSLSQQQKNKIYRERERLETARTVAALLREESDDISTITGRVINAQAASSQNSQPPDSNVGANIAGSTRTASQISLDQVGNAFNRRRLNALISHERRKMANVASMRLDQSIEVKACRVELDSHADTCGVNNAARVLEYYGQVVQVSGFANSLQPLSDIPIVKAAIALDCHDTGETVILIINQALYFGDQLSHMLLNPNQLRANGIQVDDVPKHLSSSSSHSIIINEEKLIIPLKLKGVISYFDARTPTDIELAECQHIFLTSEEEWDPNSNSFENLEEEMKSKINISSLDVNYCEHHDILISNLNRVHATKTLDKKLFVKNEELARRWAIGIKDAENTVKTTTQKFIRSAIHPIERRFRTKQLALRYNNLNCRFNSDTFFSNVTSILGNTCAQLFITEFGYGKLTPMKMKSEAGYALKELIQDVGIPKEIHSDGAKELTAGIWKQTCRETDIKVTQTEKGSPWQNRTEVEIRELKKHVRRFMDRTSCPLVLWDFCCLYTIELRNRIARPLPQLKGRTPYEILTGNTPDLSEYLEFSWYQPIWYYEPDVFPRQTKNIARWLGIAHRVGQAMCYWILPSSGIPIARTTVQAITAAELNIERVKDKLKEYDQFINDKLNHDPAVVENLQLYRQDEDDDHDFDEIALVEPEASQPDASDVEQDAYDELLLTEPLLHRDGQPLKAKIVGRKRDNDGALIGRYHPNPVLNSRIYLAEYPDGHIQELSANAIIEAIYNQIDDNGFDEQLFRDIVSHRKTAEHNNVDQERSYSTKGWEICVSWQDGTTSWHPLHDIKNTFPVQLATYALQNEIDKEPAFSWWVPYTLKKKERIIKAIKSRYSQRSHKFGIYVPRSVQEALNIDKETGTTYWRDAIQKEMTNNRVAFQFLGDHETVPIGYKWIRCHMIFDVKMDFTRKARFVAGGHMNDPPPAITYSTVVSRDSVRIAFLLAALNDVNLLATDIGNAYLNAKPRERVYTTAGPEFGNELQGKPVLIVRALYGLKSSGAAWRSHLANTLFHLGYKSSLADADVWYREAMKADGFQYYEYVLVYVDDLLVISHQGEKTMKALEEFYRLKDGFNKPSRYLGAEIKEWYFPQDNSKCKWAMSSVQYVKEAIKNIELHLFAQQRKLFVTHQPMHSEYSPELDITPFLDDELINFYQSQISILRWMIELGRLDIYLPVTLLSAYLAKPRLGHLEAVFYLFGYLKGHDKSTMVFDDQYVTWNDNDFPVYDWSDFYQGATEDIPPNAPKPRGMPVQINAFVDASHARNKITRRSHTGILIYLNKAPILWYSKSQRTIETSTFGSEFVALRIGTELIKSLRYKLRMMGVPLEGPANVLVDNNSVVKSSTIPSSTLAKKHVSICYHFVREAVAAGYIRIAFIPSEENLADMLTKPMGAMKLKTFCQRILY